MKKPFFIFILYCLSVFVLFSQDNDNISIDGVIKHEDWSKSIESWQAGGSDYFILEQKDGTRIILKESNKFKFKDFEKFKNTKVTVFGYMTQHKPYTPSDPYEQYPKDINGKPLARGGGFVVLNISPDVDNSFKTINKTMYSINYSFTKRKNIIVLSLSLQPNKGYYLNGEGYPPITLDLKGINSEIKVNPEKLSVNGIKENSKKDWNINIEPIVKTFSIEIVLKAIGCTKDICNMINDKVIIEYTE
ncbi:MAG TPA: hypothetical protein PK771_14890 [Spirochaetota bacterium]|nr:hypothetical protein [Spirochaetota bacterium]